MDTYSVIGLMSGTSLDGTDIAYCKFSFTGKKWNYQIEKALTIPYPDEWIKKLSELENKSSLDFVTTNVEFGHYLGKLLKSFMEEYHIDVDFIASHGHTIFHQADKLITSQIGDGASIAAETKQTVICDFRTLDVANGGQGAPLVPIGDRLLFNEFDFCLNLGGFSNISFEINNERVAFDICPVNIILNYLAKKTGNEYDDEGKIAEKGNINASLLVELNKLQYYKTHYPKSLSKEWLFGYFIPVLEHFSINTEDKLRTVTEHIAIQINQATSFTKNKKILITGGGAYNNFLLKRLSSFSSHQLIIPDNKTVEYKEALIFAFLGILRMRNEVNCLKSVTGARSDSSGGAIYSGFNKFI